MIDATPTGANMTREKLIEIMEAAIFGLLRLGQDGKAISQKAIAALEAAGVRLVNFAALVEDEAAVERVARAICEREGITPDDVAYTDEFGSKLQWETYTHTARAAIRAMGGE